MLLNCSICKDQCADVKLALARTYCWRWSTMGVGTAYISYLWTIVSSFGVSCVLSETCFVMWLVLGSGPWACHSGCRLASSGLRGCYSLCLCWRYTVFVGGDCWRSVFLVLSYSMFLTILHFHDGDSCAVIIFCTEKCELAYALMRMKETTHQSLILI